MSGVEYLQTFDLKLTALSPVFIGNGKTILKNGYLMDRRTGKLSVLEENKFFDLIYANGLIDRYEQFMLSGKQDLHGFLTEECGLSEKDWTPAVAYTVNARSILNEDHTLKNIATFVRDGVGRVYVPGSSVKGALRTILLFWLIQKDHAGQKDERYDERQFDRDLAEKYLHTLNLNKKKAADAVNSILRGVSVSDSLPIPDSALTLSIKNDVRVNGSVNRIATVCRECIAPGTEITLRLTLDQSVLKGRLTKEILAEAVNAFDAYYKNTYSAAFAVPERQAAVSWQNVLFLGGGPGFFSKTLVYPYYGKKYALKNTSEFMKRRFRRHRHEEDEALGISPHMLKYAEHENKLYPMGMCRVEIK